MRSVHAPARTLALLRTGRRGSRRYAPGTPAHVIVNWIGVVDGAEGVTVSVPLLAAAAGRAAAAQNEAKRHSARAQRFMAAATRHGLRRRRLRRAIHDFGMARAASALDFSVARRVLHSALHVQQPAHTPDVVMAEQAGLLAAASRLTGGVDVDLARGLWKGSGVLKGYRLPGRGGPEEEEVPPPPVVRAPVPSGSESESSDTEARRRRRKEKKEKRKEHRRRSRSRSRSGSPEKRRRHKHKRRHDDK